MDLKQATRRNYEATRKRGFINETTTKVAFYNKVLEEVEEWKEKLGKPKEKEEVIDIILTCSAYLYDAYTWEEIEKTLEAKVKINELRADYGL